MPSNKNGFIFIMVMVFIILAMVGTYSLYVLISSNYSVIGTKTATNTEGYYAAMAGLRYGAIMLRDPNVTIQIPTNGDSHTWNISSTVYPDLYNDLGLGSHTLSITITNNTPVLNGPTTYTVTASYQ